MPRIPGLLRLTALLAALVGTGSQYAQTANLPATGLQGKVRSADGKPMEGVAVSARSQGKTFTTSVFTDRDGDYYFPALSDGQYQIWAQAVGFQMALAGQVLASGKKIPQNFTLKPVQDFHMQLSGTEWANSLPGDTPEDRRMRDIVHNNCSGCHLTGYVLAKRFDSAGWGIILNTMLNHKMEPGAPNFKLITAYKEDLAGFLTKVRGPAQSPLQFKPLPRLTGESAAVVVTEYDIPSGDDPNFTLVPDGSNWAEGIATMGEAEVLHDALIAKDGNVYFSDNDTPERTIGRLDPKTGRVTGFKLPDKDGFAVRTHGTWVDPKGNVWFTNGTEGTMVMFDPKTEQFKRFPRQMADGIGKVGGGLEVDSKGMIWTSANIGAIRLNPQTGEYTDYKSITKGGSPYGVTVDAEDNAWVAQLGADRLMVINGKNGEVGEVALTPMMDGVSAKDREIGERSGAITNAAPLYQKGPRRLSADRNGDAVWVAEFWAGQLAKIDIHTRKVTEYKVPYRYSHPYAVVIDKNHMVWVCLMNSDRIAKFNPYTEQFTEYPLPSLCTNVRRLDVDNTTDPPTLWVPYTGINKIARVQFRTNPSPPSEPKQQARSTSYPGKQ